MKKLSFLFGILFLSLFLAFMNNAVFAAPIVESYDFSGINTNITGAPYTIKTDDGKIITAFPAETSEGQHAVKIAVTDEETGETAFEETQSIPKINQNIVSTTGMLYACKRSDGGFWMMTKQNDSNGTSVVIFSCYPGSGINGDVEISGSDLGNDIVEKITTSNIVGMFDKDNSVYILLNDSTLIKYETSSSLVTSSKIYDDVFLYTSAITEVDIIAGGYQVENSVNTKGVYFRIDLDNMVSYEKKYPNAPSPYYNNSVIFGIAAINGKVQYLVGENKTANLSNPDADTFSGLMISFVQDYGVSAQKTTLATGEILPDNIYFSNILSSEEQLFHITFNTFIPTKNNFLTHMYTINFDIPDNVVLEHKIQGMLSGKADFIKFGDYYNVFAHNWQDRLLNSLADINMGAKIKIPNEWLAVFDVKFVTQKWDESVNLFLHYKYDARNMYSTDVTVSYYSSEQEFLKDEECYQRIYDGADMDGVIELGYIYIDYEDIFLITVDFGNGQVFRVYPHYSNVKSIELMHTSTYRHGDNMTLYYDISSVNISDAVLVVGFYDSNGRMLSARMKELTFDEYGETEEEIVLENLSQNFEDLSSMKVMFWESVESMIPLAESKPYSI